MPLDFAHDHDHQFALKETKRKGGEETVWGPPTDWERIDIYFCIYCLEEKIVKQHASLLEFPDRAPDWW